MASVDPARKAERAPATATIQWSPGRAPNPLTGSLRFSGPNGDRELANANAILALHPDPLLVVHGKRRIVRANAAAESLFGAGLAQRDLATVLADTKILAATDGALKGESGKVVDFTLPAHFDRYFRARIEPLPDYASDGHAALLTITDFTEAKRAERLRADFVANASHELRTPLAVLLGFIETLNGSAADDPEAQRRFLPIMHQQAARMARLVDDLLSLSRIEQTEDTLPSTPIKVSRIARIAAQALKLRAAERGMWIEFNLAEKLPMVVGDRDELSQVFQNLIDNAIKYGSPNSPIEISAQPSTMLHPGIAISIRDHGDGIAERHLPRLTERFYRVDTARSRSVGGTGLGLAIVKHIVNRHRGILEIDSRVGEGSTFTVHLGGSVERNTHAPGEAIAYEYPSADAQDDSTDETPTIPSAAGPRPGERSDG